MTQILKNPPAVISSVIEPTKKMNMENISGTNNLSSIQSLVTPYLIPSNEKNGTMQTATI